LALPDCVWEEAVLVLLGGMFVVESVSPVRLLVDGMLSSEQTSEMEVVADDVGGVEIQTPLPLEDGLCVGMTVSVMV
jgi:hypothetical protein